MALWQVAMVAGLVALGLLALLAFLLWRKASAETRRFGDRLLRLPWRLRLKLAWRLTGDRRVPIALRAIPPALVVYLAMPLDLIPDVIPLVGQLDDVLVAVIALGLLARFLPLQVVDAHLADLEAEARGEST